ncbi:TonB-dependent receptor [Paraglaciecola hydrolytica]|uniref:TonB-dependent receptor n=1 Tax=Paraglaciecola hydrolytica TaxID=1799789 RepID=A0A136A1G5_9ALTE|nr:TonB-dependent receptor [Paraglaciecola hydrolytica]KXI29064.1 TonB-dependent receptor [Paraglaciecola hydrolytica]
MRPNFQKKKLATCLALLCSFQTIGINSVFAQEAAAPDDLEVIEVTGSFRDSLNRALLDKRSSIGSVDAILAEDIADFPDLNLAESLQRIPGVTISRVAGEGRQISVRGLGSEFTRVRINGMEAIATSGGTDAIGGANRGRGFDFNTFSSDLFSSLVVRKTASADVEEGSLGATVDLKASQPFDYAGFTMAASGQLGYNSLSGDKDPKASFLVSNIFADGKFGALFSVSYSQRNLEDNGASTVRWDRANDFGSYNGVTSGAELTAINDAFRPRLPRYDSYLHESDRLGMSASFQARPSSDTEISFDVLYSKNDSSRQETFMQGILNGNSQAGRMNVTAYEIDNANTMTYGAFENATIRAESRYDELTTDFTQFTLALEHTFTDRLSIDAMIGTAQSEFDNPIQTTIVMEKVGVDFSYDYRGALRDDPVLTFGSEVFDKNGWASNSLRLRPLGAENNFDTAQINLQYDLTDNLTLKTGVHYKKFEFETYEARLSTEGGATAAAISVAPEYLMEYDSGLGPNPVWLIPNRDLIADTFNIYSNTGAFAVSSQNRLADNYSASEETQGAFVQLVTDTELGSFPMRGDFGLRYVNTDQSSTAWATIGGSPELITADHDYSEVLPSMNLVFEVAEDVLVRFGYAEVMARAGLQSIRPNVSVSVSGGSRTISGGNPTLEPTRAKTYDLGVEWYFGEESVLAAAFFRKDIDSHVQNLRESKTFLETGLPLQAAKDACNAGPGYGAEFGCDENVEWNTNTPLNGPGGTVDGFEIIFQTPFTFLPGFLQDFGIMANYTQVKGQMDYVDTFGVVLATRNLMGLSEKARSATLYYEKDAFSARVSMAYRSDYLTTAIGRNGADMEGTNPTTNVDAAMSYKINDNVQVTLEALNLTDEVDDQWVDSAGNRLSYYHATGRQYYVGAKYKF